MSAGNKTTKDRVGELDDGTAQRLRQALLARVPAKELPCAVAFEVAKSVNVPPEAVGRAADDLELRLVKCQLGLFGYLPEKKIVKPASSVAPELKEAILAGLENERLPCSTAWQIGKNLGIRKMRVSAACDRMGVRIKPCQLGAF